MSDSLGSNSPMVFWKKNPWICEPICESDSGFCIFQLFNRMIAIECRLVILSERFIPLKQLTSSTFILPSVWHGAGHHFGWQCGWLGTGEKHLMRKATWYVELGRGSTAPEGADVGFWKGLILFFCFLTVIENHSTKISMAKYWVGNELRKSWDSGTMWLFACNWLCDVMSVICCNNGLMVNKVHVHYVPGTTVLMSVTNFVIPCSLALPDCSLLDLRLEDYGTETFLAWLRPWCLRHGFHWRF